jgi:hypothetical protein
MYEKHHLEKMLERLNNCNEERESASLPLSLAAKKRRQKQQQNKIDKTVSEFKEFFVIRMNSCNSTEFS